MQKKVLFLYDKKNNWSFKYLLNYRKELKKNFNNKFLFKISSDKNINERFDITFLNNLTFKINTSKKNLGLILLIHESDLPRDKGFSPLQWQLLKNRNLISFCLIKADDKFDNGDILLKKKFKFDTLDLYDELREKQFFFHKQLINEFLINYPKFNLIKQKGTSTYNRKRTFIDSKIDINRSIKSQFNKMRLINNKNWPGFFIYKDTFFKITLTKETSDDLFNLKIRNAKEKDEKIILKLRNDKLSRQMSGDKNSINLYRHKTWYSSFINSKNSKLKIGYSSNTNDLIGYVRFDKLTNISYRISINIDRRFRGMKLSIPLLIQSLRSFRRKDIFFIAEIHKDNKASLKLFKKLGFKQYSSSNNFKFFKNSLNNILEI